jgi:hypothetical protein
MESKLNATISETKSGKIRIEIDKKDFENFCNVCGLFRKDFIDILEQSERDHNQGLTTERSSLLEIIEN